MKMTIKFASEIEYRGVMMGSMKMISKLGLSEKLFGEEMDEKQMIESLEDLGVSMNGFCTEPIQLDVKGVSIDADKLRYTISIDPILMVKFIDLYSTICEKIAPMVPAFLKMLEDFGNEHEEQLEQISDDIENVVEGFIEELGLFPEDDDEDVEDLDDEDFMEE